MQLSHHQQFSNVSQVLQDLIQQLGLYVMPTLSGGTHHYGGTLKKPVLWYLFLCKKKTHKLSLSISNMSVKSDTLVKYLGLIFDSNLNWKPYLHKLSKKVSRGIGALSKIRYYVNRNILHQLYYSIIYPLLAYGLSIWGNTYNATLKPLITFQKRAIRITTFSKPDKHSEPLFKELEILKLTDLVYLLHKLQRYITYE